MYQKKGGGPGPKMYHLFFFAKTKNDQDTLKHKINTKNFTLLEGLSCQEGVYFEEMPRKL